jgi:hypothetical protein
MPLMKRLASALENCFERSMASLIETTGGDVLAEHHLEHREAQDREVDARDAVELPVVRERDLMRASISATVLDDPVDQLLAEGVVLAGLLQVLEEHRRSSARLARFVEAPGIEVLQRGNAAVLALGELGFAHDESLPADRGHARARPAANSAPRSIAPACSARSACAQRVGHQDAVDHRHARSAAATRLQGVWETLSPTMTWCWVSPPISTPEGDDAIVAGPCVGHAPGPPTGTSCEPGTRTTFTRASATPAARKPDCTRSSNASTRSSLNRAAAIPNRNRRPSRTVGAGAARLMTAAPPAQRQPARTDGGRSAPGDSGTVGFSKTASGEPESVRDPRRAPQPESWPPTRPRGYCRKSTTNDSTGSSPPAAKSDMNNLNW